MYITLRYFKIDILFLYDFTVKQYVHQSQSFTKNPKLCGKEIYQTNHLTVEFVRFCLKIEIIIRILMTCSNLKHFYYEDGQRYQRHMTYKP